MVSRNRYKNDFKNDPFTRDSPDKNYQPPSKDLAAQFSVRTALFACWPSSQDAFPGRDPKLPESIVWRVPITILTAQDLLLFWGGRHDQAAGS